MILANKLLTGVIQNDQLPDHLRLRAETEVPKPLTQAQCDKFSQDGYIVLPNTLSINTTDQLLKEALDVMDTIYKDGMNVIRHESGQVPSPVGRMLATFEGSFYR